MTTAAPKTAATAPATAPSAEPTAPEPEFGFLDQGIQDFFSTLDLSALEKGQVPEDEPTTTAAGGAAAAKGASGTGNVYVDLAASWAPQAAIWGIKNFGVQGAQMLAPAVAKAATKK